LDHSGKLLADLRFDAGQVAAAGTQNQRIRLRNLGQRRGAHGIFGELALGRSRRQSGRREDAERGIATAAEPGDARRLCCY